MESTLSKIVSSVCESIEKACLDAGYPEIEIKRTIDISGAAGDISSSAALKLAKMMGANPNDIAADLSGRILLPKYIASIGASRGFLNFQLDRPSFSRAILNEALDCDVFISDRVDGANVIIEYPSVNPNKPWHIGHLRNALIGDALARIYRAAGFEVIRENYIEDLGNQMAELLWWHKNIKFDENKKYDTLLGEEYVLLNKYIKEHPESKDEIARMLSLMHQDGTYESRLVRDIAERCVAAQDITASQFYIDHDLLVWESDLLRYKIIARALDVLKKHNIAKEIYDGDYSGCIAIDLNEFKEGDRSFEDLKENIKVLVRSSGESTYLAKDIAFHMWKFGIIEDNFNYEPFGEKGRCNTTSQNGKRMDIRPASIAINVIDARQAQSQSILKHVLGRIGLDRKIDLIHISYGEVEIPSGALSGRLGTWIGYSADDILREAKDRARAMIKPKFEMSHLEKEEISHHAAVAAIKFEFLKIGLEKKIVFSWDKALSLEGNSGPYHQYMHARAHRILEESHYSKQRINVVEVLDPEFAIIKEIAKAKDIIYKAQAENKPNVITDYLNDLSRAFSKFYEHCPILKAEDERREFLLDITRAFERTSKGTLNLIGIKALERM